MNRRSFLALSTAFGGAFALAGCEESVTVTDPENTLVLDLADGEVLIQLFPDVAPRHVARIKDLARRGFYDGLTFHRVIDGFMAQTGDPSGNGTGGSGQTIRAEFSDMPFERGTVGMARNDDSNSADSQFFICFERQPSLDGKYTVIGKVISGMDRVDGIKRGSGRSGKVDNPDKMIALHVYSDIYTPQ